VLARRSAVPVELEVGTNGRFEEGIEVAAYYVVSEALANAAKHSRAGRVLVSVGCVDERLIVEVADDGVGGADATGGSGLRGLSDRLAALNGRLSLESPEGGGTRLRAELPA